MTTEESKLEKLLQDTLVALAEPASETVPGSETSVRERFYEIIVLAMGNLFAKAPLTGQIYDRATLLRVTAGLDDGDAASLAKRSDDWLRLEGLIKQQEGQRSYFLPLSTQSALSELVGDTMLGDIFDRILKRYLEVMPSANLRRCTRLWAAIFLQRMA